jgi:hypothetical protein
MANVKADKAITLKNSDASFAKKISNSHIRPAFEEVGQKLIDRPAVHHEDRYNDFDDELLLVRMLSTEGPRLIKGDVNNDKLTDFILLGAAGDPEKLYIKKVDGKFHYKANPAFNKLTGTYESTCGAVPGL